jgi:hypothetical protein
VTLLIQEREGFDGKVSARARRTARGRSQRGRKDQIAGLMVARNRLSTGSRRENLSDAARTGPEPAQSTNLTTSSLRRRLKTMSQFLPAGNKINGTSFTAFASPRVA